MKSLTTTLGIVTVLLFLSTTLWAATTPAKRMFTPDESVTQLKAGNDRFATGNAVHPNQDRQWRDLTTSKGQHPFATVIACSDSRVPVEILFDQGVGDLFVIKVAGNVLDVDEIGSVEYGVDHLETPLMLVLGHTHCGAVTAVVHGEPVHGSIPQLVDNIIPAVNKTRKENPQLTGDALVTAAVINNVWQGINDLLMNSAATRSRINAGTLRVEGALYDIGTGKIVWLGTHPDQAAILAAAGPATGTHGVEKTSHESATPAQTEIEKQVTTEEAAREGDDHAVAADAEQAGQTEPEQAETTIQETTTQQEALNTVERQAQEMEAQATPEHVDEAGDNGLWFIFFLLVLILAGVAMKSRKNQ
jgi:carbonic anhydrase